MTTTTSSHPLSSLQEILQTVTEGLPSTPATRSSRPTRQTHRDTAPITPQPARATAPPVELQGPRPPRHRLRKPYALDIAIDWADDHHDGCVLGPTTSHRTPASDPSPNGPAPCPGASATRRRSARRDRLRAETRRPRVLSGGIRLD